MTYNFFLSLFLSAAIVACDRLPPAKITPIPDTLTLAVATPVKVRADTLPSPRDIYVNDFEGIFTDEQEDSLRMQMMAIAKKDSIVFCVVSVDTAMVKAHELDAFTLELANYWGVGDRNTNNGVVICLSKAGRRLRIENGKGISIIISNAETDEILQSFIFPAFKKGDYAGGLRQGIEALRTLITSKK